MIEVNIPGFKTLRLSHLVLDYNGTIACDGTLIAGVKERLEELASRLQVHVLTADTFGSVRQCLSGIPCEVFVISRDNQARAKMDYVENLQAASCVCIGNGRNDRIMLGEAALGIAVAQTEGGSSEAILDADILTWSILDALDLLVNPLRLIATLRS